MSQDQVYSGATEIAFHWTLSTLPLLLVLLTLVSWVPVQKLQEGVFSLVRAGMPSGVADFLVQSAQEIQGKGSGTLISFGLLVTLLGASNSMMVVMRHMNRTMGIKEDRPWWKQRLISLAMLSMFGGLIVVSVNLILFGDLLIEWLVLKEWIGEFSKVIAALFRWLLIISTMIVGIEVLYRLGPRRKWHLGLASIGSVFSALSIIVVSVGMDLYFSKIVRFDATYGNIGTMIGLMLWLQVISFVILLGSELNSTPVETGLFSSAKKRAD